MGKAEVLDEFFVSIFTGYQASHASHVPELQGEGWGNKIPLLEQSKFRDQLMRMYVYKYVGPDGMHPTVLKALADVVV